MESSKGKFQTTKCLMLHVISVSVSLSAQPWGEASCKLAASTGSGGTSWERGDAPSDTETSAPSRPASPRHRGVNAKKVRHWPSRVHGSLVPGTEGVGTPWVAVQGDRRQDVVRPPAMGRRWRPGLGAGWAHSLRFARSKQVPETPGYTTVGECLMPLSRAPESGYDRNERSHGTLQCM